ncbi:MAG: hypothetical protein NTV86_02885 [Planctomycetota bacterium]|nr:hypothetical protein [Planctomycetota bacterium]
MPNKPTTRLAGALLAAALLAAGGCSKKYERTDLTPDSALGGQITALVEALQKAASDEQALQAVVRDQLAPGLPAPAAAALEPALAALAKAKDPKLVRLDRFGKFLSATFHSTDPQSGEAKDSPFLLTDESKPRWIKPN